MKDNNKIDGKGLDKDEFNILWYIHDAMLQYQHLRAEKGYDRQDESVKKQVKKLKEVARALNNL